MTATLTATTVVVSEVFGPTIQGEGPHAGQRAAFIRLGGCNLTCSWCDTPYTWDGKRHDLRAELHRVDIDQVRKQIRDINAARVVITGGEPLLQQQHGLTELAWQLRADARSLDVETNGTIAPLPALVAVVDLFVVSPKLPHAGMPTTKTINPKALRALRETGKAVFKFVCRTPGDVLLAERVATVQRIDSNEVWIMPEGTDADTLNRRGQDLISLALACGFNYTTRLHVLLWGSERGR
jgi:7-cyano-7-deazaguanosine (preQ0) biosynthesis protein QueE